MFEGRQASGLNVNHLQKQNFIKKDHWQSGLWHEEEDLAQFTIDGDENKFEGLIVRCPSGELRAFLGVYDDHPAYGKDHTEFRFLRLSGGLVRSGHLPPLGMVMYSIRPRDVWWFEIGLPADSLAPSRAGFATGRYYDVEFMLMQLDYLAEYFASGRVDSRSKEDEAPTLIEIASNKWREGFEFDFSQT